MVNSTLLISSFVQGVFTFFAPCAVALLPGYLSRLINKSSSEETSKTKLLLRSLYLAFLTILGIVTIYVIFGGLLIVFKEVMKPIINYLSIGLGVLVIILGIFMVLGKSISLNIHASKKANSDSSEAYLFGFGYGIAALGCLFPFFLVLATAALQAPTHAESALYFLAYALGMSLLMLVFYILVLFSKSKLQLFIRKFMPQFTRISGVIIILSGIYIIWYQSVLFI